MAWIVRRATSRRTNRRALTDTPLKRSVMQRGEGTMKSYLVALSVLLASFAAQSQEVRIGHLETANDTGINWLFFHCSQAGSALRCAVFQTLMITNQEPATCSVMNDFSEMAFTWNPATQSWLSREGPTGPCGRISIGTLERDPGAKQFWKY